MNNNYNPHSAIVIYVNKSSSEKEVYLERREYNDNSKCFGAGHPLSQEEYNEIALSIKEDSLKQGLKTKSIIKNLLSFDYSVGKLNIVWKVKAGPRKLFFVESLGLKSDTYFIPHLIFQLNNKTLNVYATKTYNINEKTKIYKAPFHNISSNGSICMGTAKGSNNLKYIEDIIESWETAFFNSTFTHFNDSKATKLNLVDVFKESKKTKSFNNKALMESKVKVKDLL